MSDPISKATSPTYGVTVCRDCDPVRPENLGPELDIEEYGECPGCGAPLFGLLGTLPLPWKVGGSGPDGR